MLRIAPEKICFIVLKAREFDAKVEVVEPNPGSNPSDGDMREVLEDYDDDAVYEELVAFIGAQNEDEQVELVALTWIGRGDFGKSEVAEARAQARNARNGRTAEYLLGIPLLSDYLEMGLEQLGESCEEFKKGHL